MTDREMLEAIRRQQIEIDALKALLANRPMRLAVNGPFTLPPPKSRYKLLTLVDDHGNFDWDDFRFSTKEET